MADQKHAEFSMDEAAAKGDITLVRKMHEAGEKCTVAAMDRAAASGHHEVVQFLHSIGASCTTAAADGAIANGHHDMMRWLHLHRGEGWSRDTIDREMAKGNVGFAVWLREHYRIHERKAPPLSIDEAAHNGDESMVIQLDQLDRNWQGGKPSGIICTTDAMDSAARNGHMPIVKRLHEHRKEGCTTAAMDDAAANGHYDVVSFLILNRKEGCTKNAMDWAAAENHLEVLKLLHSNRAVCSTNAMDFAAARGHLEVVKWLHSIGASCTAGAMDNAIRNNHPDVVKFLHAHRGEGCTRAALDYVALRGNVNIETWLQANPRPSDQKDGVLPVVCICEKMSASVRARLEGVVARNIEAVLDAIRVSKKYVNVGAAAADTVANQKFLELFHDLATTWRKAIATGEAISNPSSRGVHIGHVVLSAVQKVAGARRLPDNLQIWHLIPFLHELFESMMAGQPRDEFPDSLRRLMPSSAFMIELAQEAVYLHL